jgi:hypothetical protein
VSSATRSLDDLDRLAFRLARIIRQHYPQLMTQGFTLIDLEERLLPFRETRREMADGGAESWERAMLRLLAGERDILAVEPTLRDACRKALELPSPTLALVREWSNSLLSMGTQNVGLEDATVGSSAPPPMRAGARPSTRGCRYCGGRVPDGRRVTFCPHCGTDLTKRQCPACSTELEAAWRFCVTCGRGAEAPAADAIAAAHATGQAPPQLRVAS